MEYKLYNGDCITTMKKFADCSIDLVITDPPYRMTKCGKSCRPNYMHNNMGDNLFSGELPDTYEWMCECYRVLKEQSHFYTFCNINEIQNYLSIADKVGFKLHNIITMVKDTKMPNRWYMKYCEYILFFRKGKAKPINDVTSRDYYQVVMPTQKNGKVHITQKPQQIIEMFVRNSSSENDTVLDLFMGSGTTGVACAETGRNFIGIELDANYFNIAKQRIENVL